MPNKLEVSFNSPQCGWMSVGFDDGENEFHTTTAHTPHSHALSEILRGLSSFLQSESEKNEFDVAWSRNPEEYKLFFVRNGYNVFFQVVQYLPNTEENTEGEIVFSHNGLVKDFCEAFYQTFAQLYEDRETDEFEFNWRQPFPFDEFTNFQENLKNYGQ
ncbi:MAG TPA: hypothetical protein PKY59_00890 [Pyrinomonadaceae bacterium]|nr:hypothetical protein [Pyrinomonadaceae bacterium]